MSLIKACTEKVYAKKGSKDIYNLTQVDISDSYEIPEADKHLLPILQEALGAHGQDKQEKSKKRGPPELTERAQV